MNRPDGRERAGRLPALALAPARGSNGLMKLSPRLLRIAGLVPEDAVVADIGTDRALLPVYLVVTGRCQRAIATEVKPGPLEGARQTIRRFGVGGQVDLRLGYGLTVLEPHEADAVVIAGMGWRTIVAILERSPAVRATVRRFVLQPMDGAGALRRWLLDHGFRLAEEDLAREDDRYYEVLAAEPGQEEKPFPPLAQLGLEVGPRLWERRHPLLRPFIEERLNRYRSLLARIERSRLEREAAGAFARKARALEELLAALDGERAGREGPWKS